MDSVYSRWCDDIEVCGMLRSRPCGIQVASIMQFEVWVECLADVWLISGRHPRIL